MRIRKVGARGGADYRARAAARQPPGGGTLAPDSAVVQVELRLGQLDAEQVDVGAAPEVDVGVGADDRDLDLVCHHARQVDLVDVVLVVGDLGVDALREGEGVGAGAAGDGHGP